MNTPIPPPRPAGPTGAEARAHSTRRVSRTRTLLVSGAIVGSLAASGALVLATTGGAATATTSTSSSTTSSGGRSQQADTSSLLGSGVASSPTQATSAGS